MSMLDLARETPPWRWASRLKRRLVLAKRERVARVLLRMKPRLVPAPSPQLASIHMLTCRRDWLGALWSVRTFIENLGEPLPVFFHDDGTLTRKIADEMRHFLPGATVVSVPQANAEAERRFVAFPRCLAARQRHAMLYKLLDAPCFAQGERYFLLDSDLLFFAYPDTVAQWLRGDERVNLWNRDCKNYLNVTAQQALDRHGVRVVENINAGMGCVWRESIDFNFLEDYFGYDTVWLPKPYNAEQTAFALLSSRFGTRFLPPAYLIDINRTTGLPEGIVMKHYLGIIRDLFFSEGIPHLLAHGFVPTER